MTLAALALGGASYATASVLSEEEPAGPAREEIDSFAADAGISKSAARAQIIDQLKLEPLDKAARSSLGSAYAGLWVDAEGDGRIKLALVDGSSAGSVRVAQDQIEQIELSGRVDIVRSPRGIDEMEQLQREIDAELVGVNRGAETTVDVEPDVMRGVVVVRRVAPASATTPRQKGYLAAVKRRFGDAVEIGAGLGKAELK